MIKSYLDEIPTLLKRIDAIIHENWRDSETDSDFVMTANQLAFVGKVLEVNSNLLQNFANTYKLIDEPTIPATLARAAFELHLIFLEALSDSKSFIETLIKASDSFELFTEKFLKIAERKGDHHAMRTLVDELTRLGMLRKRYEKLLGVSLDTSSELKPYFSFKELAKNHGFLEEYDIEYNLLSSFIHPTLLQIMTTEPRGKTASEEKQKLMKSNVEGRKRIVKKTSIYVILGMSSKTIQKAKDFIKRFSAHVKNERKVTPRKKKYVL